MLQATKKIHGKLIMLLKTYSTPITLSKDKKPEEAEVRQSKWFR